jgi:hypothetical protein
VLWIAPEPFTQRRRLAALARIGKGIDDGHRVEWRHIGRRIKW